MQFIQSTGKLEKYNNEKAHISLIFTVNTDQSLDVAGYLDSNLFKKQKINEGELFNLIIIDDNKIVVERIEPKNYSQFEKIYQEYFNEIENTYLI